MLDGQFTFLTLSMASGYVFAEMQDHGYNVMRELIPHKHVRGENNGKPEKGGFLMDFRIQANGMEDQLEELKSRFNKTYLNDIWERAGYDWMNRGEDSVFILETNEDDENNRHIIFSDPEVLKKIRFESFVADCKSLEKAPKSLNDYLGAEKDKCRAWLVEQLKDINENYDPKIKKFQKKRKIVVSPKAAKDLL